MGIDKFREKHSHSAKHYAVTLPLARGLPPGAPFHEVRSTNTYWKIPRHLQMPDRPEHFAVGAVPAGEGDKGTVLAGHLMRS